MNPDLTETQSLLQSTIRQYLEQELPFDRVRELEWKDTADEELWKGMVAQGWLGVALPEKVGGAGEGLVEAGILVHELARRAAVVPAAEGMVAARILSEHGGEDCEELLSRLVQGSAVVVPALLEADDRMASPTARVDEAGRLTGEKHYVDYADFASHHLVAARGPQGPGLYLVERGASAVGSEPLRTTGRTPASIVRYAEVPARRVAGVEALAALVDVGRALASVQILACMEVALEQTVAYTNIREQFGRPLATFQAVQHHAANMAMHVESSRFLVYELLDGLQAGRASHADAALVKASLSRAVPEVTMLAHQLHGGQGLIEENDLYFFTIRGKDRALAWGTAEECLAEIAQEVETPPRWL